MEYRLINCDSLIKKITSKDKLFRGRYCIDPYQNCEFGCKYCDSSFDKTIYIKTNASTLLEEELEKLEKGMILIGYVNDPYQKAEEKYEITKNLLKIIKSYTFPCHIQTKSDLILRDINILSDMQCTVTISITTFDKKKLQIFEKNVPSFEERLNIVKNLLKQNIKTGLAIIPILPFLVDYELEEIVKYAKGSNAKYLLHKYMELKGDQKEIFTKNIKNYYPHILSKYEKLYKDDFKPNKGYIEELNRNMYKLCMKYDISQRISL